MCVGGGVTPGPHGRLLLVVPGHPVHLLAPCADTAAVSHCCAQAEW